MRSYPGIVFMGTPEFAVESLSALINAGFPVRGVVTSPDKPSGRGLQLHPSPVKQFALAHQLPVFQPLKLKDSGFLKALQALQADLQVVVAFRMLPEEVWSMPKLGTFNLHASLLPHYRGAAPINWAVMNGETHTGVTTFFINHEIDKGSVILAEETYIGPEETAGDVHDRLMSIGARLVVKTVEVIASGQVKSFEQDQMPREDVLKAAPKIFKHDCRINWDTSVDTLYNFIRGLSPFPTAWSELIIGSGDILTVKVYYGTILRRAHCHEPGAIETDGKSYLSVAAGNGYINIESLQLQGKRRMAVAEFLRGFPLIRACTFR